MNPAEEEKRKTAKGNFCFDESNREREPSFSSFLQRATFVCLPGNVSSKHLPQRHVSRKSYDMKIDSNCEFELARRNTEANDSNEKRKQGYTHGDSSGMIQGMKWHRGEISESLCRGDSSRQQTLLDVAGSPRG